ncbi:hypothetical protein CAPTEDRAFT_185150 [Capitella teleta]|uniref:FAM65 N-terminal domain-containing protein n=1 Tax=Capitella teleta TaxID=283909 RepID=R7TGZ4_CAPTE|nr:hypothetical protein CAPTEDRAFT_185150 [Capitella teleta]|eukprot:ELT93088.1 hypothetical protein CAPTEDRAFT_185150 [Capitella teleta]
MRSESLSLKEPNRPIHLPTQQPNLLRASVARSKSFHGMPSTSSTPNGPRGTPVLGDGLGSRARTPHSQGAKRTPKIPKNPRPPRTMAILTSVKKGVRECVTTTQSDIEILRATEDLTSSSTGQARVLDIEKQVKAAIRHKKRLEFHLAKIEEIEEQYVLHQQLREGARTMAKAFTSLARSTSKESINSVERGYKECTQLEAQLEALLGTFHCQLKGMAGFARMMPGDVFEVTFRLGFQKWKSKGRIGAGHVRNAQTWHPNNQTFKALLGDVLNIKAVEMKGLGKHVLLGQKNCETRDLFSAHPQLMTVSVNNTGTLKVTAVITWNPLDGVEEASPVTLKQPDFPHPAFITGTSSDYNSDHSPMSTPSVSGGPSRHSFPPSSLSSQDLGASPELRSGSMYAMRSTMDTISEDISKPKLFDMRLLAESVNTDVRNGTTTHSLNEALQSLRMNLEDYQGRYPELQTLEEQIHYLDRILQKASSGGSLATEGIVQSESNASIENALGAFDFLEQEAYVLDNPTATDIQRRNSLEVLEANCSLSPESTTKTADSGIESIANRLSEASAFDSSMGSLSADLASTGNDQVDIALLWHLQYCEKLLDNLGSFGPLKCKEIYSLDKLQKQAKIIDQLIRLALRSPNVSDLQKIMSGLSQSKGLRQFWVRCVDDAVLYVSTDKALAQLEKCFADLIAERYDISPNKVLRTLLSRILDTTFDPVEQSSHVTVHQFLLFFASESSDVCLQECVLSLASELWVCDRLKSGNTDITIKTLLSYEEALPPPSCVLRVIALLLLVDNVQVRTTASNYLKKIRTNPAVREKVVVCYVESLEDASADIRCSACVALKFIQAVEAVDQLVYVSQNDRSGVVKNRARDTVLSFGLEGRKALEQSDLPSHGFHGFNL